jgi:hypothetical protein
MKYYRINEKVLHEYLTMAHYFHALECGGVDNWEWYSESINDYIKDCSAIDFTNYESIEEIVESEMAEMEICHCEPSRSTFDTMVEILTENFTK